MGKVAFWTWVWGSLLCFAVLLFTMFAPPAHSATVPVTPPSIVAAYTQASCGDTLVATVGAYSGQTFPKAGTRDCGNNPIIFDLRAQGLTVTGWKFNSPKGVTLLGNRNGPTYYAPGPVNGAYGTALAFAGTTNADGTPKWDCAGVSVSYGHFLGPEVRTGGSPYVPAQGYAISGTNCNGISVDSIVEEAFAHGLVFGISEYITVTNSTGKYNSSDFLDLGGVWHGTISGNVCFGNRITGAQHPDCIQAWSALVYPHSTTSMPPTSDITVSNNRCMGDEQCVFFGDHNVGGFDRITISGNDGWMSGGQAISAGNARSSTGTDNHAHTLPGSAFVATVNFSSSPGLTHCNNTYDAGAGKPGWNDGNCP